MRVPSRLVRRLAAVGLAAMLVTPLLGALHHHPVDHDGGAHHIEATHGGHVPTLTETDSKLPCGTLEAPLPAVATGAPDLAGLSSMFAAAIPIEGVGPPPRAPPGVSRSRAPPA